MFFGQQKSTPEKAVLHTGEWWKVLQMPHPAWVRLSGNIFKHICCILRISVFVQINWLYIIWQDRMGFHWMLGVAGFQKMSSLCTSGLHWNCSTYCMSGICWNYPPQVTVTTRMISFSIGNPYQPSFVIVTGWGVDWRYVVWVVKLQIFHVFYSVLLGKWSNLTAWSRQLL